MPSVSNLQNKAEVHAPAVQEAMERSITEAGAVLASICADRAAAAAVAVEAKAAA